MTGLFIYLFKLSISVAVVSIFYRLVLRRMTFYSWNRWYLLGYSFLSFFIAFIDVTPLLQSEAAPYHRVAQIIPAIRFYSDKISFLATTTTATSSRHSWSWFALILIAGTLTLLIRLFIQFISFLNVRRKARLFSSGGVRVYHVNNDIMPFSFGRSIFINMQRHSAKELDEIISHEFIHVKQRHSIDILWSELLCAVNWYNPFTWLLRASIRQNLEFIADNKVLQRGINKKEYQYLLLKVIGDKQFSFASNFNFSSLKKRIVMMNKMKTARINLARFLFLLPMIALTLLAFRSVNTGKALVHLQRQNFPKPIEVSSLVPIADGDTTPSKNDELQKDVNRASNDFEITDKRALIHLRNGKTEEYDLTDSVQRHKFEKNYGKIISVAANGDDIAPATLIAGSGETMTVTNVGIATTVEPVVSASGNVSTIGVADTSPAYATTAITPVGPAGRVAIVEDGETITDDDNILVTISRNTTQQQLEDIKKQVKEKGYELSFDETKYDKKDVLISISGTIRSKETSSNFVGSDFDKLILSTFKKDNRTYFKVLVKERAKVVI